MSSNKKLGIVMLMRQTELKALKETYQYFNSWP